MNSKNTYNESSELSKLERILEEYTICLGDFINITTPNIIKDLKISVPIAINIFDVILENTEEFSENQELYNEYLKILKVFGFATLRSCVIENFKNGNDDAIENFINITKYFTYYSEKFPDVDLRDLVMVLQDKIKKLDEKIQNFCNSFVLFDNYDQYSGLVKNLIFSYKYFGIQSKIALVSEGSFYLYKFHHTISNKNIVIQFSGDQLKEELDQWFTQFEALRIKYPKENFDNIEIQLSQIQKILITKIEVEKILSGDKTQVLTPVSERDGDLAYQYYIGAKGTLR